MFSGQEKSKEKLDSGLTDCRNDDSCAEALSPGCVTNYYGIDRIAPAGIELGECKGFSDSRFPYSMVTGISLAWTCCKARNFALTTVAVIFKRR